ncbi:MULTISPECIES: LysR substrate-binding domain-containing protein [unclassified Pseudomonas]|uniref:LysR substrate-binding domain-containing protein n=1 Tax=unclassified Pseudomonas TaxID=196821 RepID=UPI000BD94ECE|nr:MULTISPECIES: LysR substrate-binding domain-containing protein [unclassified Pseudomonas]PVZ16079.1 LysR family glycine cleavage system transcriptional activator [Pseudomonas sp. URIL14HWK12:I12]PVZ26065.1 LysR family glycine cleavage system transcriptional activator [Pseudomonas sp. URIL14HWK12:I10]PVZ36411.1 LysR family glycine cleavage system transcriptional activator [Pseudomonas sp. URIL14HWK12:I11]SNZ18473.1 LysR family transcriptional regulator, glycine cleavage system transcriptional
MPEPFAGLPSLNALRVFEVVSRHLNFRLAADELGVTQAAVAQQVRGLEAALAIRLFDRLPRGLGLTDAGRRYSTSVRDALAMLQEATRALRPQPASLTISVTPSFASKWLIPRLGAFTQAHPGVDLRVLATDQLSRFHTDGVDIAVRYGRPPFGPGIDAELLFEQRVIAVASPALLAAGGAPSDLDHLQGLALLHDAHNFWPGYLARLFGRAQAAKRNLRFNQTALAIEAALAGQGVALVTDLFVHEDLCSGRLVQVFDQALTVDKHFYLTWPRKGHPAQALAYLRQWLREQAALSSSFSIA